MEKMTITFEVVAITRAELHELLCKAIHEGDVTSMEKLDANIIDIE
ncbi:hypothetical protein LCGC14_2886850 [marine sediment metagenome]|uniref:Uncharacterized protein n=1 Tax=marine sediment metagenome TaxID=412755 RepID=A0A0F8XYF8_9ZZZZ